MQYSEEVIEPIKEEDFTTYFIWSLDNHPHVIDVITIIYKNVDFSKAEAEAVIH